MLEDLCLSAITTDPVNLCLDGLWQCLESQLPDGRRSHTREAAPKARIHAWLATRPIPDLRLGEAALNGDVDFNHAAFDGLNQFLNAL